MGRILARKAYLPTGYPWSWLVRKCIPTYPPSAPQVVCKALSSTCTTIRFSKSIPTYPPSDSAFPPKINTYLPLSSWAHSYPTQGYSETLRTKKYKRGILSRNTPRRKSNPKIIATAVLLGEFITPPEVANTSLGF